MLLRGCLFDGQDSERDVLRIEARREGTQRDVSGLTPLMDGSPREGKSRTRGCYLRSPITGLSKLKPPPGALTDTEVAEMRAVPHMR